MPVRKIPKNYLFVTGYHSSPKAVPDGGAGFESPLEKDFMLLLDFDDRVAQYEGQPVKVPLSKGRGYVPDILVMYVPGPDEVPLSPHELVEVKASSDLAENADAYAEKFEAAEVYAQERGWRFVIKTESDIRTLRLETIKFLRGYKRHSLSPVHRDRIVTCLSEMGGRCTSEILLAQVAPTPADRGDWIPSIWSLVAAGEVLLNMDGGISGNIQLWLPEGQA